MVGAGLLLSMGLLAGCSHDDPKKPAQLYDPGQEAQQKVIADQADAALKKKKHDQHMPGY